MIYPEAIRWWFGRVNFELKTPEPSDLKLDRMRLLLDRLGNPQDRCKIVHVAGSKGKGSTAAMLAGILQRAGFKTGLFTSPNLVHVEERFQVDGAAIEQDALTQALVAVRAAAQAPETKGAAPLDAALTFFEIATAAGMLHFAQRQVDWAVLEVGLGGRFDSTNVCTPELAVITSISFDHTFQLGNTLAKIAGEKAGIVKPGLPTVSGVINAEARDVIRSTCRERRSPLRERDTDFRFAHQPGLFHNGTARWPRVQVTTWRRAWPEFQVGLIGEHQAANAALAVAAVEVLQERGAAIPDDAVRQGLAEVQWPARLEIVGHRPLVLLDCAHNVASAEALVNTLVTSFPLAAGGKRRLIFASSKDKDIAGMLRVFAPHVDHMYLTRFHVNPRCTPPEDVRAVAPAGLVEKTSVHESALEAWQAARAAARPQDLICITGSVFLAGELRPLLHGE